MDERLSEFAYGYGVTRELEDLISFAGYQCIPFLPNLIHENSLGYDVKLSAAGTVLLVQFKLGRSVSRYHLHLGETAPPPGLSRPFRRFELNTGDPQGQFQLLRAAESKGALAFYAAPRFGDWQAYGKAYLEGALLDQSILLTPAHIEAVLSGVMAPAGIHQVIFDDQQQYIRSQPLPLLPLSRQGLIVRLALQATALSDQLKNLSSMWDEVEADARLVSGESPNPDKVPADGGFFFLPDFPVLSYSDIRDRAKRMHDDTWFSDFVAFGYRAWCSGFQSFLIATPGKDLMR